MVEGIGVLDLIVYILNVNTFSGMATISCSCKVAGLVNYSSIEPLCQDTDDGAAPALPL